MDALEAIATWELIMSHCGLVLGCWLANQQQPECGTCMWHFRSFSDAQSNCKRILSMHRHLVQQEGQLPIKVPIWASGPHWHAEHHIPQWAGGRVLDKLDDGWMWYSSRMRSRIRVRVRVRVSVRVSFANRRQALFASFFGVSTSCGC